MSSKEGNEPAKNARRAVTPALLNNAVVAVAQAYGEALAQQDEEIQSLRARLEFCIGHSRELGRKLEEADRRLAGFRDSPSAEPVASVEVGQSLATDPAWK